MSKQLIPISQASTLLTLNKGKYDLFICGGYFYHNNGSFHLRIVNVLNKQKIPIESARRSRGNHGGTLRTVQYGAFQLPADGEYEIRIENPNDLIVKRSMLFSVNLFLPAIPTSEVFIVVRRNYYA